jgi:hypothetical protein
VLRVACNKCGRAGRCYRLNRLIENHGRRCLRIL